MPKYWASKRSRQGKSEINRIALSGEVYTVKGQLEIFIEWSTKNSCSGKIKPDDRCEIESQLNDIIKKLRNSNISANSLKRQRDKVFGLKDTLCLIADESGYPDSLF